MTRSREILITLPEDLIERAQAAGLNMSNLSDEVAALLEAKIARQAKAQRPTHALRSPTGNFASEIEKIVAHCKANLRFGDYSTPLEYGYPSLILCIIDTIFAIGVRYGSTEAVVKRFSQYVGDALSTLSISQFISLYETHGLDFMVEQVYQNRQRTSPTSGILKGEAVLMVARVMQQFGVEYMADMQALIENPAFEAAYRQIPGQSSGVSLVYLYMQLGSQDHIKPGRRILSFLSDALDRPVQIEECRPLLRKACQVLVSDVPTLKPRTLDHLIWRFQSDRDD